MLHKGFSAALLLKTERIVRAQEFISCLADRETQGRGLFAFFPLEILVQERLLPEKFTNNQRRFPRDFFTGFGLRKSSD
jgi:hypothetical protein